MCVSGRYVFLATAPVTYLERAGSTSPPPVIRADPLPRIASPGATATFSVTAVGDPPFTFQWTFNGNEISGATNFVHTVTDVDANKVGYYGVIVRNVGGTATSAGAALELVFRPVIETFGSAAPHLVPTNSFSFSFPTQHGIIYSVESTSTVQPTFWHLDTNVIGNDGIKEVRLPRAGEPRRFFRVRAHK